MNSYYPGNQANNPDPSYDQPHLQGHPAIEAALEKAKPTNPKQLYGDKKPPVHLIHQIAELHESAALHAGKRKYGENNYIQTEVEAMTYVGAILRHVKAWASGERVDPKELVHHLGAVKACCTILMTTEATGMLVDNRPVTGSEVSRVNQAPVSYKQATAEALKEVEATIEHLNQLYPVKL
ncbi:dATP/dGTP diphosphohydrolase domain-containing protein [Caballeronia temeraria]|nr:dATP/dGTP diphosphohydrolase domain-containing protein [Caballeronia temeraria]